MRMLVLGAGLQGSACAYDLLQDPEVTEVRLADLHVGHLPEFLAPYSGPRLLPTPLDVRDHDAVLGVMRECDAVMSAIPYYFNYDLAELRRRGRRALLRPRRQHRDRVQAEGARRRGATRRTSPSFPTAVSRRAW